MTSVLLVCVLCLFQYGSVLGYRAAVFEHYALESDTPLNTMLKNIEEYRQYADKARLQSADIIVFPEYGITTVVKDPEEYAVEVSEKNDIIIKLRDIAFDRQIYMVVNLLEKVQESNKATKYYNTNLVFGRNGTIILKYRKINLFDESKLTAGDEDQGLTFTTDFGVTFGIFTCFDILFDNPSRRVLENNDVTDIVYPTAWLSIMPFFTSLTVQHGYSVANGVNLLAANYGRAKQGHGGSGIYLADGKVAEIFISDSPSSKPLIQDVRLTSKVDKTICLGKAPRGLPGPQDKSNVTNFNTTKNFRPSDYVFKDVDLTKDSEVQVCDEAFCCTFTFTLAPLIPIKTPVYKVMAFEGTVTEDSRNLHLRICSLLACETSDVATCGNRLESVSSKFTQISVKGNMKNEEKTYYVPLTLDTNLLPIRDTLYCKDDNGTDTAFVQLSTTMAQENVLVFGLLGKTVSAASSIHCFGFLFLMIGTIVKFLIF